LYIRTVLKRIIPLVAQFSSLAALVMYFIPDYTKLNLWVIALMVFAILIFIYMIVSEIKENARLSVFKINDNKNIKKYMHKWIFEGGRVAIWTRDMSWADNYETIELLSNKARHNELIICTPKQFTIMDQLIDAGAEVHLYDKIDFVPRSRFTIVQFGREGSRVAVGRRVGNNHVIKEYASGEHPIFALAEDLINFAIKVESAYDAN